MHCTMKYTHLALLTTAATLTACAAPGEPPETGQRIGMPNPASTHCIERGGRLEIRKDADGNETGWCHLPDGRVVEEWTLFRGDAQGEKQP